MGFRDARQPSRGGGGGCRRTIRAREAAVAAPGPESGREGRDRRARGRRRGRPQRASRRHHAGGGRLDFEPTAGAGRYYVYYMPYKSGGRLELPEHHLPAGGRDGRRRVALRSRQRSARAARRASSGSRRSTRSTTLRADGSDRDAGRSRAAARRARRRRIPRVPGGPAALHPHARPAAPNAGSTRGPTASFAGSARRGEYFAFQLGVYARRALGNVRVTIGDASRGRAAARITANRTDVLNQGGTNWDGARFTRARGRARRPRAGDVVRHRRADATRRRAPTSGTATVTADGAAPVTVTVSLVVRADSVLAGGADEPEKMTRLKWLNSTLGQRNDVIAPVHADRRTRQHAAFPRALADTRRVGPPRADRDLLHARDDRAFERPRTPCSQRPVRLDVTAAGAEARAPRRAPPAALQLRAARAGTVSWVVDHSAGAYDLEVRGTLEFDGYLTYQMRLLARRALALGDVQLAIPYATPAATYAMGLGLKGERRPASFDWTLGRREEEPGRRLARRRERRAVLLAARRELRAAAEHELLPAEAAAAPAVVGERGARAAISWREENGRGAGARDERRAHAGGRAIRCASTCASW